MAETPQLAKYLPRILAYPLSGYALGALLLLTLCLWMGTQSVMGIALFAIAAPWTFHYAEAVIDRTANGQATPPRFGGDMIFLGSNARALRPLVGVGLIAGGYLLAGSHGAGARLAVLAAGALLFPAFMLVLTVENSVLAALNPLQLAPAIAGVGPAYLVLCLLLTAVAGVIVFAAGSATQFVALLVAIYLWLMSFHLLGYVAFHRSAQLGLKLTRGPVTDESRRMAEQEARLAAVLRNIDAALHAKDLDAAAKALHAEPGGPADVRLFHEELFEQLQRRKDVTLIHAQGARLVGVLVRNKLVGRALDVAETCYDTHKDFSTEKPADAVALAAAAMAARREGLFTRLTHDAAQRYGKDPAVVSLQFLAARYAYDVQRDEARAREILRPLLGATTHPQHRQIAAYARALGVG